MNHTGRNAMWQRHGYAVLPRRALLSVLRIRRRRRRARGDVAARPRHHASPVLSLLLRLSSSFHPSVVSISSEACRPDACRAMRLRHVRPGAIRAERNGEHGVSIHEDATAVFFSFITVIYLLPLYIYCRLPVIFSSCGFSVLQLIK